jgi:hypothetical protein
MGKVTISEHRMAVVAAWLAAALGSFAAAAQVKTNVPDVCPSRRRSDDKLMARLNNPFS